VSGLSVRKICLNADEFKIEMYPPTTMAPSFAPPGVLDPVSSTSKGHVYKTVFPRAEDTSIEAIRKAYAGLANINNPDVTKLQLDKALFFVIRSNNEDDVHKAMKYGVWTSTRRTNALLSAAYNDNRDVPIYLIYSVVKSGQFVGVAKMTSPVEYTDSFAYWWEPLKWFGRMTLQWIYVKDVAAKEVQFMIK
jgi:hypothetical protein